MWPTQRSRGPVKPKILSGGRGPLCFLIFLSLLHHCVFVGAWDLAGRSHSQPAGEHLLTFSRCRGDESRSEAAAASPTTVPLYICQRARPAEALLDEVSRSGLAQRNLQPGSACLLLITELQLGSMRHRSEADTDGTERRGSGRITGNENREICKTHHWWREISVDWANIP